MNTVIKSKTKVEHVWDLSIAGHVIGKASAIYITDTQRKWNTSVTIPTATGKYVKEYNGYASIAKLVAALEADIIDLVVTPPPKEDVKQKYEYPRILTSSMVDESNVFELTKHYGHDIVSEIPIEQVKYVLGLLKERAARIKAVPMSDLLDIVNKQTFTTKALHHYGDD